jgi:hypothetical protein
MFWRSDALECEATLFKKDCKETGIKYLFATVKPTPRLRNFFKEARQGAAAVCLLIFLAVQAMAAVPALHALVHSNSSEASHQCAVTLILHGQVHAASATVDAVRSAPEFSTEPLSGNAVFVSADVRLLACRGPPSLRPVC